MWSSISMSSIHYPPCSCLSRSVRYGWPLFMFCQYRLGQTTGPSQEYCWIIALMVPKGGGGLNRIAHSTQKLNVPWTCFSLIDLDSGNSCPACSSCCSLFLSSVKQDCTRTAVIVPAHIQPLCITSLLSVIINAYVFHTGDTMLCIM